MTAPKPRDPDAITLAKAAAILNTTTDRVTQMRRDGLLIRLTGYPSYSRSDVQQVADNPWLTGVQAAAILGVSRTRVYQLADAEKIPVHRTARGRRLYRQQQLEVVAHACRVKFRGEDIRPMPPVS
jgi:excisionase family DNA binding protein